MRNSVPFWDHLSSRNSSSVHGLARVPISKYEEELHENGDYDRITASFIRSPPGLDKYINCYKKVPWDVAAVNDIWFALHYFEGFVAQLMKLRAMTMCHPFTVKIQGMPSKLQPFLNELVQHTWLDFAYLIFLYRIGFGIVPYYMVPIEGTSHAYPVVPLIEHGRVVSFTDENDAQHYEWEWYDNVQCARGSPEWKEIQDKRAKRRMFFIRTGYEPMQCGKLRAPACAILDRYREVVLAGRDEMYASYWSTHPLAVYENKPPASSNQREDKSLRAAALDFGEDVIGIMNQYEAELKERSRFSSEKQVAEELERLGKLHTDFGQFMEGIKRLDPVLQSDAGNEEQRLKFQHNHLLLPRDVTFARQAEPKIVVDPEKKRDGAIAMAAELVGIPIELTQTRSRSTKMNTEGIFTSTKETLKAHINWINLALTRVFTNVYGETITRGWEKLHKPPRRTFQTQSQELRYEIELASQVDIQVTLYCDPIINKGDVYDLVSRGFMSEEEAIKQLASILGLPDGVLKVLPVPEVEVPGPTAKPKPIVKNNKEKK